MASDGRESRLRTWIREENRGRTRAYRTKQARASQREIMAGGQRHEVNVVLGQTADPCCLCGVVDVVLVGAGDQLGCCGGAAGYQQ
ncbi:Uncharacterised protein [Mycobacteroides abscessus subsp. massiliense]|nr:Uncharacterised protein [Mycobacteroides abscessus subsp. massiliense]